MWAFEYLKVHFVILNVLTTVKYIQNKFKFSHIFSRFRGCICNLCTFYCCQGHFHIGPSEWRHLFVRTFSDWFANLTFIFYWYKNLLNFFSRKMGCGSQWIFKKSSWYSNTDIKLALGWNNEMSYYYIDSKILYFHITCRTIVDMTFSILYLLNHTPR